MYCVGYYTREECHIDLLRLCSFAKAVLVHTEVVGLDIVNQEIFCSDGRPPIKYDVLSINVGITPKPFLHSSTLTIQSKQSFNIGITPVKPIDGFCSRWDNILERLRSIALDRSKCDVFNIAVVGGGAGGVELCFAMHYRMGIELSRLNVSHFEVKVSLFSSGRSVLSSHCPAAREIVHRLLNEKGIDVHTDANICNVERNESASKLTVISTSGLRFVCDEVIWCTQAIGQVASWTNGHGGMSLECNENGFINVKPTLQSVTVPNVFAAGDICNNLTYPRPKAGVFAVRAGPPLVANIRHYLLKEPLEDWIPQVDFLGIIGCGDGYAVASKGGMAVEGRHLWKLKDKIDRCENALCISIV